MAIIGIPLMEAQGVKVSTILKFLNLYGVELCELHTVETSLSDLPSIQNSMGRVKFTIHLPQVDVDGFDFSTKDAEDRINNVIATIVRCNDSLGFLQCVAHPPYNPKNMSFYCEKLSRLPIPVVLENVKENTDKEFVSFYSAIKKQVGDRLHGWLFDIAHSYLVNGPEKYLDLLDKLPFSELKQLHLSNCGEREDSHIPFNEGVIPAKEALRTIRNRGYNGIIINEIKPFPSVWGMVDSYKMTAYIFKKSLYANIAIRDLFLRPILKPQLRKMGILNV